MMPDAGGLVVFLILLAVAFVVGLGWFVASQIFSRDARILRARRRDARRHRRLAARREAERRRIR